jgi:hypothetical protein
MGENDKRDGRRVVIMPRSSDGLRGQQRDAAVKSEALALSDAIVGALDIIDLFQHEGGIVLVANGEVRNVNSELLPWLIEASFVEKHVVRKLLGLRHEVEYRPVSPSEQAVRALLRAEPREGPDCGVQMADRLRIGRVCGGVWSDRISGRAELVSYYGWQVCRRT